MLTFPRAFTLSSTFVVARTAKLSLKACHTISLKPQADILKSQIATKFTIKMTVELTFEKFCQEPLTRGRWVLLRSYSLLVNPLCRRRVMTTAPQEKPLLLCMRAANNQTRSKLGCKRLRTSQVVT